MTTNSPAPGSAEARPAERPPARRGALAVFAIFVLHGFASGSWVARLPTVRGDLALLPRAVGLVLLVGSLGNLVSMPLAGALIQRFGTRRSVVIASAGYAVFLVSGAVAVLAGTALGLAVFLFLAQACSGVWTTAFNAASGRAERAVGRPIIPRFHAGWSLGTVIASSSTTLLVRHGIGLVPHLAVVTALVLIANLGLTALLLPDPTAHDRVQKALDATAAGVLADAGTMPPEGGSAASAAPVRLPSAAAAWRERRTVLIGVLLLACGLAEGSANDWIALGVTDDFGGGTDATVGTIALTVFVSFMMLTRIVGTGAIARLGRVRTMRASLALATCGLLLFALSGSLPLALVGVALWACGSALGFPLGMSAASDDPLWTTVRVAVVSAIAYGSSLAGPPILGLVADATGYRHALLLIVVVLVPSFWIAGVLAPQTGGEKG